MITRIALTISSLALLAAAPPNSSPRGVVPAQRAQAGQTDLVHIALETEKGRILVALDRGRAPLSTANFLRYVEAKRFDGITFYRAMPYGAGNGLIQAGILRDARLLFPAVAHEPASKTGLKHEAGTILLANAGPGTAKSDFFITLGPIPFGDDFAPFGKVVEGMDVVKAVFASPTDPERGVGPMKGQMLSPAISIRTARVVTPDP